MEYEPNYSTYTLDELRDAIDHVNREKYPEIAQRLDDEMLRRPGGRSDVNLPLVSTRTDTALERNPQPAKLLPELPLEFRGSAREYFRIWIVNLCLTLLTLGIFSAWAKVRKKRYTYSHTTVGGTPFQYLGQPIPILKGRLIAGIGFGVYYVSTHFITSLLPYVLAAGLVVAPWVLVRSAAFNARYSAFRNMTFHFDGGYLDALKVFYAWSIIPLCICHRRDDVRLGGKAHRAGIASAMFGFSFPWFIRRLKKFIVEHTSYGGKEGAFSATGGQFFKIYFISGLITFAVAILSVILVLILFGPTEIVAFALSRRRADICGYVLAYAFFRRAAATLSGTIRASGRFVFSPPCAGQVW